MRAALIGCAAVLLLLTGCGSTKHSPRSVDLSPAASVSGPSGPTGPSRPTGRVHDEHYHPPPARRPRITWKPIPFGPKRRREMAAYAQRHYGIHSALLKHPHVIVEHYTANSSFSATYNTFAPDNPDPELHERPNVCAHFVVDRDGRIYQLVRLRYMCRHTVGLNYTSFGVEHVGMSDGEILRNHRQMRSSLRLSRWLRCNFHIRLRNVIGHNESLRSPYHRERVARLRHQTHGDWTHGDMKKYRRKLGALGAC